MLKIYDQNGNPAGYITKYKDLCIESDLSTGDKSLSFTYCAKNITKTIRNEYYVETQEDRFVVKEVDESSDGFPSYLCELDLEDLESFMHQTFSAMKSTLTDAARLALAGTGWTADTDIEKVRSVATLKATPLTVLEKIRDAWMCEMRFDTKKKIVYFREQLGEDKGVYFASGLNLIRVKNSGDTNNFYTRIIPIGKDGLKITEVNDGVEYVENYQYSNKIRTLIWEDSNYEDADTLLTDAEAKLEDLSVPKESYQADVIDLAKLRPEYKLLDYGLGDTVLIMDASTGTKVKQRIVKMKCYPQTPEKNTCELSNTTWSWDEWQAKLDAAADALENITNADGTINGVYVKGTINADGIVGIETIIKESSSVKEISSNLVTIKGDVSSISSTVTSLDGELSTVKARIGTIETTYIKATDADLKYATIERADILEENVHSISGDYANFKSTITDEVAAQTGRIDTLSGDVATFKTTVTDEINAQTGKIDTISGEVSNFKTTVTEQLDAQTAQINTISGDLSSYKTSVSQELVAAKGWMLEGAIGDAQIGSISANKLTSGTIDAAKITVKNLNADNITVGTINGKLIGEGSVSLDSLTETVPTKQYVDEEISSLQTRTSTVEDSLGTKVETTTFNKLKQSVEGNASEITTLTETVQKKADDSTVTALGNKVNSIEQTASGNSAKISELVKTVDTKADGSTVSSLETRTSSLEQNLSGFKSTVSGTYVAQTTYNTDKKTMEGNISTANSNASSAVAKASQASTDASSAVSTANAAKESATGASNSAATAVSTANEANKTAAEAKSTAGTAATNAANAVSTANSALSAIEVKDTRDTNETPSWYIKNYPLRTVYEFKSCSKIGLSGSVETYCHLTTYVPWGDSSGGYPKQVARVKSGDGMKEFWRNGTGDSAWGSWYDGKGTLTDFILTTYSTYVEQTDEQIALMAKQSTVDTLTGRVSSAEGSISAQAEQISLKVNKNGVISAINQSSESVQINANKIALTAKGIVDIINSGTTTISADKINLSGYVTVNSLKSAGMTVIEGGGITAEKLTLKGKSSININDVFKVDADGTIYGTRGQLGALCLGSANVFPASVNTGLYISSGTGTITDDVLNGDKVKKITATKDATVYFPIYQMQTAQIYMYMYSQYYDYECIYYDASGNYISPDEEWGTSAPIKESGTPTLTKQAFSADKSTSHYSTAKKNKMAYFRVIMELYAGDTCYYKNTANVQQKILTYNADTLAGSDNGVYLGMDGFSMGRNVVIDIFGNAKFENIEIKSGQIGNMSVAEDGSMEISAAKGSVILGYDSYPVYIPGAGSYIDYNGNAHLKEVQVSDVRTYGGVSLNELNAKRSDMLNIIYRDRISTWSSASQIAKGAGIYYIGEIDANYWNTILNGQSIQNVGDYVLYIMQWNGQADNIVFGTGFLVSPRYNAPIFVHVWLGNFSLWKL